MGMTKKRYYIIILFDNRVTYYLIQIKVYLTSLSLVSKTVPSRIQYYCIPDFVFTFAFFRVINVFILVFIIHRSRCKRNFRIDGGELRVGGFLFPVEPRLNTVMWCSFLRFLSFASESLKIHFPPVVWPTPLRMIFRLNHLKAALMSYRVLCNTANVNIKKKFLKMSKMYLE